MSEATVRQQWPITRGDCKGFTQRQQKNKAWGAAGGKLNFASRGTEGIRGLGDSWEAISLASYFLTADRGIGSWPQSNNRIFFFFLAYLGVIYKHTGGIFRNQKPKIFPENQKQRCGRSSPRCTLSYKSSNSLRIVDVYVAIMST